MTLRRIAVLRVSGLAGPGAIAGGVWRVALAQSAALSSSNARVRLVSGWRGRPPQLTAQHKQSVELYRVHSMPGGGGLRALWGLRYALALARAVRQADVVHVDWCRDAMTTFAITAAVFARVPVVAQCHGMLTPARSQGIRIYDWLLTERLLSKPAVYLTLTAAEQRALSALGVPKRKMIEIHNAVPAPIETAEGQARGSRHHFVFLARLHQRKNPAVFINAAARVNSRHADVRFTMVGPDAGEHRAALALIRSLGITNIQVIPGVDHNRAMEILSTATAMVLPSVDEPYPMAVLEAASLGVPSIVTETCGLSELISSRSAGIVTSPSESALADAMIRMLDRPDLAERLGNEAFALYREVWSLPSLKEALMKTYRTVVS